MDINAEVSLRIDDLGSAGEGIGRVEGLAVFVPGAVPGDVVRAEITENRGRFARGRLVCIEKASPDRTEPDCPYFGRCGGCSLRNLSYEAQLSWKEGFVRENLRRIGGIEDPLVRPIIGMEQPFRYRNKAEFAVVKGRVGYYAAGSRELIPVEDCLIQQDPACSLARALQAFLKVHPKNIYRHLVVRTSQEGKVMAIVVVNKNEVTHAQELADAFSEAVKEPFELVSLVVNINKDTVNNIMGPDCLYLAGPRVLKDIIKTGAGTLNIEVSPLSFTQVNPLQCGRLYSKAQEYAGLTGSETVLDLYCGTGTIGLSMAGKASRIIGVESVKPAVIDANRNAVLNGIVNAEFICGKAEEIVPKRLRGVKAQVVILDPPRAGCRPELLETVAGINPERIVYVSCNPSTLARDLKILSGLGYGFIEAAPVDMFPFSSHAECVTLITRK